jgi:Tol biopolymer transport system component
LGEDWEFARLRAVEVATKRVSTLVSGSSHVYDFAWSPDSKPLACTTQKTPEGTSADIDGTSLQVVIVDDQRVSKLAHFPAPLDDLCWIASDLWWRATYGTPF